MMTLHAALDALPPPWGEYPLTLLREKLLGGTHSMVVLDDGPTGIQTVWDVPVLTEWSLHALGAELSAGTPLFFVLTNSRSLPPQEAVALAGEIARNLRSAARLTGRKLNVISRSDSTLRGHYPVEVDALAESLGEPDSIQVIAPSFVQALAGLACRPPLTVEELRDEPARPDSRSAAGAHGQAAGGLIIVGSHVPQTTQQLQELRHGTALAEFEFPVEPSLSGESLESETAALAAAIEKELSSGRDVVLFTSRDVAVGSDAAASLAISGRVSTALVRTVQALQDTHRFLLAKGGITSSDIATRALGVRRALVCGQILPGVPARRPGAGAKFPGITFIVFPGSVGGPQALLDAYRKLAAC